MANKSKTHSKKKNSGMIKLKIVAQMLQKSLLLGKRLSSSKEDEEVNVPGDVKAGHFAVIAVDDYELKRFVVPLSYLTYPSFLRLLEQAEEEYGFDHEGALTIPCSPSEFERLLAENWAEGSGGSTVASDGGTAWSSFNKTMVIKSC